nr:stressosome-associated protein Prli42 [Staphylococcus agnetis]
MEATIVLNEKVRKVLLMVMLIAIVISLILTGVAPILNM